jgi:hypothetical protein
MAMSKDVGITADQLSKAVEPDISELMDEVARAVNEAGAGRVIADSEEVVRDAIGRFRQKVYERAIQMRAEAAEAAFPPSGQSEQ